MTPKVLVVGHSFHSKSGGGITPASLFKNWPKNNIAVIAPSFSEDNTICTNHYIIGFENVKKIWPLSLLQARNKSGLYYFSNQITINEQIKEQIKEQRLRKLQLKSLLKKIGYFLGIHLIFNKIHITTDLDKFINEFQPHIIYTQLASLELIVFVMKLHKKYRCPIVIHIMDDWPLKINNYGLLGRFWHSFTIKKFKLLLKHSSLNLAISDMMALEYERRYKVKWHTYNNIVDSEPIELNNNYEYLSHKINIAYFGNLNSNNQETISTFIISLDYINKNCGYDISFHIYSPLLQIKNLYNKYNFCKTLEPIPYDNIHAKMNEYDFLLLPLGFSKENIEFVKYSIPTKFVDYLVALRPIIVFAPQETAIVQYAASYNCAFILDENKTTSIIENLLKIFQDKDQIQKICLNAKVTYQLKHNAGLLRKRFIEQLNSIIISKEIY